MLYFFAAALDFFSQIVYNLASMKHLSKSFVAYFACLCLLSQALLDPAFALAPPSAFVPPMDRQPEFVECEFQDDAARLAAMRMADLIAKNNSDNKNTVITFFTGNTAQLFYREFVDLVKERGLDMSRVITFNLDEYVLHPKHPKSYRSFMQAHLFDHVNIKPENIHFLSAYDGNGILLDETALKNHMSAYEQKLKDLGGADITMLGIGPNGHIAFNEPDDPDTQEHGLTHKVILTESTRRANAADFENDWNKVPSEALTMGIGNILRSKSIMLLAFGEKKQEAVRRMREDPVGAQLPASFLRRHANVTAFTDAKALPKRLTPEEIRKQERYQNRLAKLFKLLRWVNEMKKHYSLQTAMGIVMASLLAGAISLNVLALTVASSSVTGAAIVATAAAAPMFGVQRFLTWRNQVLDRRNSFHGLKAGEEGIRGEVVYGIFRDSQANEWNYARPLHARDPSRPVIEFAHGRDPFEFFSGAVSKIKDFFHFTVLGYDKRYYWSDVPGTDFLRSWAEGKYLRPGKSVRDNSMILSTNYADMPHWPFSNIVKFKKLASGALHHFFPMVRNGELASLFPREPGKPHVFPTETVCVAYSVGARVKFIEAVHEHVRYDEKTKVLTLADDVNPKIRALVLVNTFFQTSRIGNEFMRWQRRWFWDPLKHFMGEKESAYDEMDRSYDLSKLHEKARLAAQHKDWPQVVWIRTRLQDADLRPLPWNELAERVENAPGFWARWQARGQNLMEIAAEIRKKTSFAWHRKGGFPWYYWIGSIFRDTRGNDAIVDPVLAAGWDYNGKAQDPGGIAMDVLDIAHDAMGEAMIQRLTSQVAELAADGADISKAHLIVEPENGGEPYAVYFKDHGPEKPVVLNPKDTVNLYYSTPVETMEPLRESLAADELREQSDLPGVANTWNAQSLMSLRALEFFKSALMRRAWPLGTEIKRLGPAIALPGTRFTSQDIRDARAMIRARFDLDWVSTVTVLQMWLAQGLAGMVAFPPGESVESWKTLIQHANSIAEHRSKSRWVANPLNVSELTTLHRADAKLRAHAMEIIDKMDDDYIEQFNAVLSEVMGNPGKIWGEFSQNEEFLEWMGKRQTDFVSWIESSPEALDLARELLGVGRTGALQILWEEYRSGRMTAEALYQSLLRDRPRRLLQTLMTLDLKIPVGGTVHVLAIRQAAQPITPFVDMAA